MRYYLQRIKNIWHLIRAVYWVLYYGYPAKKMMVVGVTGTDGKTTTTTVLYEVMKRAGLKAGMVSTIGGMYIDTTVDVGLHTTTPDVRVLQRILRQMRDAGVTHVVLEVTAHGLDQYRVFGCNFQIGVMTNFTQDHLDDFGTMERYATAKAKLFTHVAYSVLNRDDSWFEYFKKRAGGVIVEYAKTSLKNIHSTLGGEYNLYNIGAVEAVTKILGIRPQILEETVKNFAGVAGRREEVKNDLGIRMIVDFAHTANGIKQLLVSLRKELPKGAKLLLVYGCTGGRDKSKRPEMGKVGATLADVVIITADDLREEDQDEIYAQMVSGVAEQDKRKVHKENDRDTAIRLAVGMAKKGDIVIASGMGHETTQLIGKQEIKRSDKQAFLAALQ